MFKNEKNSFGSYSNSQKNNSYFGSKTPENNFDNSYERYLLIKKLQNDNRGTYPPKM